MRHRPLCPAFLILVFLISVLQFLQIPLPGALSLTETEKNQLEYRYGPPDSKGNRRISAARTVKIEGTVSERWKSRDGYTYVLKDTSLPGAQKNISLHKVRVNTTQEKLKIGTRIQARGKLVFTEHASNPGGFDSFLYYAGDDIYSAFSMKNFRILQEAGANNIAEKAAQLREQIAEIFRTGMGETAGGILSAMLLGDRSGIEEETRTNYSVSGLGHLLAISGLHVGVIGAALLAALKRLRLPNAAALSGSVLGLFAYCQFAGSRDSTMRAFLMFSVMAAARFLLRSYDMLSSLSLAGILLLLGNPYRLFRSGFMLSFGAAAGLGTVYPVLRHWIPAERSSRKRTKVKKFFLEGFFVWLSVTAVTLPIVLWNYNELPVYGAAANVLFVPLTEGIILLGIAGALLSLLIPILGNGLLFIPKTLIFLQNGAGDVFRRLPGATMITGQPDAFRIVLYYSGLIVLLLAVKQKAEKGEQKQNEEEENLPRSKKAAALGPAAVLCAGILISLVFIRPYHGFSITALDVGQGDSIVITTGKDTLMIDGGSSSMSQCGKYVLLPYLKNQGISCVDAVMITHSDSDYMNGILELLQQSSQNLTTVRIKRLIMPSWMRDDEIGQNLKTAAEEAGTEVIYLAKGDLLKSAEVSMRILAPEADSGYTGNEGSLTVGLTYGTFRALFTGDLEGKAEEELTPELDHYDYLKAAHHGSSGSTSEAFLAAVTPDLSIISAPKLSSYDHPGADTIERIEKAGSVWLQTGFLGAITVSYDKGRIHVETKKENNILQS